MSERAGKRFSIKEMRAFIRSLPKPEGVVLNYNISRMRQVLKKPGYEIFSQIPGESEDFSQWEHDHPERSEELNLALHNLFKELENRPE